MRLSALPGRPPIRRSASALDEHPIALIGGRVDRILESDPAHALLDHRAHRRHGVRHVAGPPIEERHEDEIPGAHFALETKLLVAELDRALGGALYFDVEDGVGEVVRAAVREVRRTLRFG